jgi:hypothetical protein
MGALGVFVLGLVLAIPRDRARLHMLEHGRRLKGPQMVTVEEFNRWSRADGIGFVTGERKQMLAIPRSFESSHMMIMGDSGTGKSALLRQVLMQIAERRETAIVYDPALEYTPQFYQPSRGDLILNPLDARCPYEDLPFSDRLSNIETFSRQDKLQDICALAQKRLKFCAEKAIWGDFLQVLVSQTDLAWVNTSMRQVSGLLSEPLTMDESLFG